MAGHAKRERAEMISAWETITKQVDQELEGFSRAFDLQKRLKKEEQEEIEARERRVAAAG